MAKLTHKIFDERVKAAMSPGGAMPRKNGLQQHLAKLKATKKVVR